MLNFIFGSFGISKNDETDIIKLLERQKDFKKLSKFEKSQALCIQISSELAKKGKGALIVVGNTKSYKTLFPNFFRNNNTSIFQKGMEKVLMQLAELDGALVISEDGIVKAYGAMLTKSSTFKGAGTRHSAAKGISAERNIVAILASEEDKLVRIFKNASLSAEINPHTKNVENHVSKVVRFVNTPEGAVAAGAAIAIPFLGIPGVVVFAGSYYVVRNILKLAKGRHS
ncbi:MAG: hypothetical protein QT12_C0008G0018 [archaeon GW2011_AR21]|nr:MAG: hypothetical protein QT12_C0008G0018 [archaeon GW2011_AR21]